jgi:gas vesicle protein
MSKTSKIALGILGAAAAGVVIGLLLAPEKGSDTRKKIKKTAGDWADNLSHLFSRAEDGVDEVKEHVKRKKSALEGE